MSIATPNAALEWQAGGLGWRIRKAMAACPLEVLVRFPAMPKKSILELVTTRHHIGFILL